jgi:hypothetical protein
VEGKVKAEPKVIGSRFRVQRFKGYKRNGFDLMVCLLDRIYRINMIFTSEFVYALLCRNQQIVIRQSSIFISIWTAY